MKVEIDGIKYPVIENLGFVHDVGARAVVIKIGGGEKIAVKSSSGWRLWTNRMGGPRFVLTGQ